MIKNNEKIKKKKKKEKSLERELSGSEHLLFAKDPGLIPSTYLVFRNPL